MVSIEILPTSLMYQKYYLIIIILSLCLVLIHLGAPSLQFVLCFKSIISPYYRVKISEVQIF